MHLWEALPASVTSSPTLSVFKTRFYAHLFADNVRATDETDCKYRTLLLRRKSD